MSARLSKSTKVSAAVARLVVLQQRRDGPAIATVSFYPYLVALLTQLSTAVEVTEYADSILPCIRLTRLVKGASAACLCLALLYSHVDKKSD